MKKAKKKRAESRCTRCHYQSTDRKDFHDHLRKKHPEIAARCGKHTKKAEEVEQLAPPPADGAETQGLCFKGHTISEQIESGRAEIKEMQAAIKQTQTRLKALEIIQVQEKHLLEA